MASDKAVGSASAPTDDSDLEDLIAKSPRGNVEIDSGSGDSRGSSGSLLNPLTFITGSFRLCCYKFPCLSKCALSIMAFGIIAFLSNTVFNPSQKMGIMGDDYSAITSAYELSISKVDHWCIQGDNDSCKCEDPLEPNSRSEFKAWNAAHKANVADVDFYRAIHGSAPTLLEERTGKPRPPIDVAFLGESVVEAMDGRWLGKRVARAVNTADGKEGPEAKNKPDIGKVFERLFRKEKGGPVEGVALGIAGDNTANVLWRLQHDEMPYDFNPQVWWLVLGMNDLTRMQCSEEIVVLGILRVVEEIRFRKPDAKIVINSLLPMINYQSREQIKMADFADFKKDGDNVRENMEIDRAKKTFKDKGLSPNKKAGNAGKPNERRRLQSKGAKRTKKERVRDEDNAREGPDLQAALERRKKILEVKDKKVRGKVFKDDEKYHPKGPVSKFLPIIKKRVLPPVWPSVHLINDRLREFCSKHDDITFFDATPIFASDQGGGKHQLRNELISPRGHPSELGFAFWEGHIMGRLHKWIVEKPDPPPKEDPDEEALSVEREVSDEDGESGDGSDHVSDGKEAEDEEAEQPSRDDPPPEEEKVKGNKKVDVEEEEEEEVEEDDDEEEEEEEVEEDDDEEEEEEEIEEDDDAEEEE